MAQISSLQVTVKKGDFFSSFGDFFTKDIPAGFAVVKTDIVHVAHVVGVAVGGAIVPFVVANIVPAIKTTLMTDAVSGLAITPAGLVVAGVTAGLSALFAIAGKAPDNSIVKQVTDAIPASVATAEINKIAGDAGKLVGGK